MDSGGTRNPLHPRHRNRRARSGRLAARTDARHSSRSPVRGRPRLGVRKSLAVHGAKGSNPETPALRPLRRRPRLAGRSRWRARWKPSSCATVNGCCLARLEKMRQLFPALRGHHLLARRSVGLNILFAHSAIACLSAHVHIPISPPNLPPTSTQGRGSSPARRPPLGLQQRNRHRRCPLRNFEPGQPVAIQASNGKTLGTGYINPHALLCARLISRDLSIPSARRCWCTASTWR